MRDKVFRFKTTKLLLCLDFIAPDATPSRRGRRTRMDWKQGRGPQPR